MYSTVSTLQLLRSASHDIIENGMVGFTADGGLPYTASSYTFCFCQQRGSGCSVDSKYYGDDQILTIRYCGVLSLRTSVLAGFCSRDCKVVIASSVSFGHVATTLLSLLHTLLHSGRGKKSSSSDGSHLLVNLFRTIFIDSRARPTKTLRPLILPVSSLDKPERRKEPLRHSCPWSQSPQDHSPCSLENYSPLPGITFAACTALIFAIQPGAGCTLRTVRSSSEE